MKRTILYSLFISAALLSGCREDEEVIQPVTDETGHQAVTDYLGMYVLCEGNMGANKATLDYLDLHTGVYHKNIFPSRNPQQVKELGDVGNDCKIYGSRLWLVINSSNKVEVCTADSALSLGHVDIPNCRFLAFSGGYAYVSSYVGPVGGASVRGSVYKVDTLTLRIAGQVAVGYQPEEMAVVGDKLYVANSGGYEAMQGLPYDRTVSIIDLKTFTTAGTIDVAPNLFRLRADRQGQLWVASRGDYTTDYPSRLYLLAENDKGQMQKADSVDVPVSDLAFRGDSLCYVGATYDAQWNQVTNYGVVDTKSHQIISRQLVKDASQIETAYGLMVHPQTGDIYVMDATNFVSSGWLFCFDAQGNYKWKTSTGDIPGHACWNIER
ncbi:MAG: YncE family protein [Prevotella sp.]|nr:YncE family protein [Prevotella sp.]